MSAFVETALRVSIRFTNAMKGVTTADVRAHADIYNAIRKHNPKLARRKVEVLLDESIELIEKGRAREAD